MTGTRLKADERAELLGLLRLLQWGSTVEWKSVGVVVQQCPACGGGNAIKGDLPEAFHDGHQDWCSIAKWLKRLEGTQ